MAKNIVVFSDGTGQDGGVRPEQCLSNVYKLYRACRVGPENAIDPREQVAFYDAGLGTDVGATALSAPVRFVQKLLSSVTGRGITTNIVDCYEFIINHYEPEDRIFLIGFSRGAYTVRCIANLLMLCGVPTSAPEGILPKFRKATRDIAAEAVFEVFEHGAGHPRGKYEDERVEKARRFREKYGSNGAEKDVSNAAPYFIGVFDTVAALGAKGIKRLMISMGLLMAGIIPITLISEFAKFVFGFGFWNSFIPIAIVSISYGLWAWLRPAFKTIRDYPDRGDFRWNFSIWKGENFDKLLSRHVGYARSVNAIDETRADFARVPWGTAGKVRAKEGVEPEPLVQMWFSGNHSDIGGSYPESESRLSDISLTWMIEQALEIPNPLKVGPVIVNGQALTGTGSSGTVLYTHPDASGVQHNEITSMRDTLDNLPWFLRIFTKKLNWEEKQREIDSGAVTHPTVKERFELNSAVKCDGFGPYRPSSLNKNPDFQSFYKY